VSVGYFSVASSPCVCMDPSEVSAMIEHMSRLGMHEQQRRALGAHNFDRGVALQAEKHLLEAERDTLLAKVVAIRRMYAHNKKKLGDLETLHAANLELTRKMKTMHTEEHVVTIELRNRQLLHEKEEEIGRLTRDLATAHSAAPAVATAAGAAAGGGGSASVPATPTDKDHKAMIASAMAAEYDDFCTGVCTLLVKHIASVAKLKLNDPAAMPEVNKFIKGLHALINNTVQVFIDSITTYTNYTITIGTKKLSSRETNQLRPCLTLFIRGMTSSLMTGILAISETHNLKHLFNRSDMDLFPPHINKLAITEGVLLNNMLRSLMPLQTGSMVLLEKLHPIILTGNKLSFSINIENVDGKRYAYVGLSVHSTDNASIQHNLSLLISHIICNMVAISLFSLSVITPFKNADPNQVLTLKYDAKMHHFFRAAQEMILIVGSALLSGVPQIDQFLDDSHDFTVVGKNMQINDRAVNEYLLPAYMHNMLTDIVEKMEISDIRNDAAYIQECARLTQNFAQLAAAEKASAAAAAAAAKP